MQERNIEELLRQIQEHCGDDDDLSRRYRDYQRVDTDNALERMMQRMHPEQAKTVSLWQRHRYAIAAAIAVLIVGGLYWYWQYAKVVPPTISEEVLVAMARCEQNGFQEAEVEQLGIDADGIAVAGSARTDNSKDVQSPTPRTVQGKTDAVEQLLQAKRVTTHNDKEYWLTLPDGSLVHLNYNTRIVFPEQFTADTRDVYLEGEAYLMVAKDKRHPFIVHTPSGDIRVHGTEFCVNTTDADNSRTRVVLVNGKISVTMKGGEPHEMQPSDMALLYPNRTKPVMSQVDVEPYIAWNTGKFSFEDCALERLMTVLSKWYGYHVEFDEENTRQLTFTGELDRYSTIEPVLRAISKTMNLRIEMNNGNILISNPQTIENI